MLYIQLQKKRQLQESKGQRSQPKKRYRSSRTPSSPHSQPEGIPKLDENIPCIPLVLQSSTIVRNNLPQPLEDEALKHDFTQLRTRIKNHVEEFYHCQPVYVTELEHLALETFGKGKSPPLDASTLRSTLIDPQSRMAALRYYIAWNILSRVTLDEDPLKSYLPQEVADDPVRRKKATFPTTSCSAPSRRSPWGWWIGRWPTACVCRPGRSTKDTVATRHFWTIRKLKKPLKQFSPNQPGNCGPMISTIWCRC